MPQTDRQRVTQGDEQEGTVVLSNSKLNAVGKKALGNNIQPMGSFSHARPTSTSISSISSASSTKSKRRSRANSIFFKTMGGSEIVHTGSSRSNSAAASRDDDDSRSNNNNNNKLNVDKNAEAEGTAANQADTATSDDNEVGKEKSGEVDGDEIDYREFEGADDYDEEEDEDAAFFDYIEEKYSEEDLDGLKKHKGSIRRKSITK